MENKIIRALVNLGVPGVALGIFYLLLKEFGFEFSTIGASWSACIAILFILVVGGITFYALYRPQPAPPTDTTVITSPAITAKDDEEKEIMISILYKKSLKRHKTNKLQKDDLWPFQERVIPMMFEFSQINENISSFTCLDVEKHRWIAIPTKLSEIDTTHIGLIFDEDKQRIGANGMNADVWSDLLVMMAKKEK